MLGRFDSIHSVSSNKLIYSLGLSFYVAACMYLISLVSAHLQKLVYIIWPYIEN